MLQARLAYLIARPSKSSTITEPAWLDSLHVRRKRGHGRQECSRQGSLFSSPIFISSVSPHSQAAWLDSLRVCRKRGHRRQECSRQGSLFSSPD